MGRIEADFALKSWLFGFRPCSGQGQFTLLIKLRYLRHLFHTSILQCPRIRESINGTQSKIIFHSLLHIFSSFSTVFHFIIKMFAFNKLNDKLNICQVPSDLDLDLT